MTDETTDLVRLNAATAPSLKVKNGAPAELAIAVDRVGEYGDWWGTTDARGAGSNGSRVQYPSPPEEEQPREVHGVVAAHGATYQ